jgi:hypothetical protein
VDTGRSRAQRRALCVSRRLRSTRHTRALEARRPSHQLGIGVAYPRPLTFRRKAAGWRHRNTTTTAERTPCTTPTLIAPEVGKFLPSGCFLAPAGSCCAQHAGRGRPLVRQAEHPWSPRADPSSDLGAGRTRKEDRRPSVIPRVWSAGIGYRLSFGFTTENTEGTEGSRKTARSMWVCCCTPSCSP